MEQTWTCRTLKKCMAEEEGIIDFAEKQLIESLVGHSFFSLLKKKERDEQCVHSGNQSDSCSFPGKYRYRIVSVCVCKEVIDSPKYKTVVKGKRIKNNLIHRGSDPENIIILQLL